MHKHCNHITFQNLGVASKAATRCLALVMFRHDFYEFDTARS